MIRVTDFKVVHFVDQKTNQNVVLMYALGEDGVVREFASGKWTGYPITEGDYQPLAKEEKANDAAPR